MKGVLLSNSNVKPNKQLAHKTLSVTSCMSTPDISAHVGIAYSHTPRVFAAFSTEYEYVGDNKRKQKGSKVPKKQCNYNNQHKTVHTKQGKQVHAKQGKQRHMLIRSR
jgi:hypothetical protein